MIRRSLTALGLLGALVLLSAAGPAAAQEVPYQDGGYWLPPAASDYSGDVDFMYRVIFWVTAGMFILTEGLLIAFCIMYRRRPGHKPTYTHGSHKAEITWTVIPALMLLGLAVWQIPHWNHIKVDFPASGEGVTTVDVLAEQYKWNFRYPGSKKKYEGDYDFTNLTNLHVPFGDTVLMNLRSKDVIHSFFLPHHRVKQDAVPGLRQRVWFKPNRMLLVDLKGPVGTDGHKTADGKGPRKIQPKAWVYLGDKAPDEKSFIEKDLQQGGKLFDKKIAVSGVSDYMEVDGYYDVYKPGGTPRKVTVLHQGKVMSQKQEWKDCDYALGIHEVACAELCGMGHYTMFAKMVVEPRVSFEHWLEDETVNAGEPPVAWKFWRD